MKKITNELIDEKMMARGFKTEDVNALETEDLLDFIEQKYGIEFDDVYKRSAYDFAIYDESTADGYTVYVVRYYLGYSISVANSIYMYEDALSDALTEAITDLGREECDLNFLIYDMSSDWFLDSLQTLYSEEYDEELEKLMKVLKNEGYEE